MEKAKIVTRMDHYGKRKVHKALEIELNENINGDEGLRIRDAWILVLDPLKNYEDTIPSERSGKLIHFGYIFICI